METQLYLKKCDIFNVKFGKSLFESNVYITINNIFSVILQMEHRKK